jgi:hypothetical protein
MTPSTPTDRAVFEDEGPGKLFAPKLGGVPWTGIASSQALGALVGAVFFRVLRDSSAVGVFCMAAVWVAATVQLAVVPYLRAASTRIVFDEGGVRLKIGAQCTYRPFAPGSKGHHVEVFLAPTAIRLCDPEGRPFVETPALGTMALYEAKDLIARFNRCSRAADPRVPPALEPFVRGEKTLDAWRAELDGLVRNAHDTGYRGAGIDDQALLSVLRDRRRLPDLRAAAAYTLLATKSPALCAAVKKRLGAAAPPLVLALASLAPGGAGVVRPADLAGALPFLSDEDRLALRSR